MKKKNKIKNRHNSKWNSIIDRCFEKTPTASQRQLLGDMQKSMRIYGDLTKRQAVITVRIARSLKAYYPDKKHESLTQKLIRVSAEKRKSEFKIKNIGGFVGLRKKEQSC